MPMYRYNCPNCGNEIIILRSMSDQSPVFCRECGTQMNKVISNVGIIFKGSGFYSTDSRRNNGGKNKATNTSKGSQSEASKSSSCSSCSSTSCSNCK